MNGKQIKKRVCFAPFFMRRLKSRFLLLQIVSWNSYFLSLGSQNSLQDPILFRILSLKNSPIMYHHAEVVLLDQEGKEQGRSVVWYDKFPSEHDRVLALLMKIDQLQPHKRFELRISHAPGKILDAYKQAFASHKSTVELMNQRLLKRIFRGNDDIVATIRSYMPIIP